PLDLPAGRLPLLIGSRPGAAVLESGPGFGAAGRWSIYTAEPRLVFEANEHGWWITGELPATVDRKGDGDPLAALDRLLHTYSLADSAESTEPDSCPFSGGLIGW